MARRLQATPANNAKELIAYAKANPGKLNYGSFGAGTLSPRERRLGRLRRSNVPDISTLPRAGHYCVAVTRFRFGFTKYSADSIISKPISVL